MSREERIAVDPKILTGKPIVRGTRISVEFVIELLANGWSEQQILDSYPYLTRDDIRACLNYVHPTRSGVPCNPTVDIPRRT